MLVAVACVIVLNARTLALQGIGGYQRFLAPQAARFGLRCRFTPSCSRYAIAVIERDGVVAGGAKALKRIARCGPWMAAGTDDQP